MVVLVPSYIYLSNKSRPLLPMNYQYIFSCGKTEPLFNLFSDNYSLKSSASSSLFSLPSKIRKKTNDQGMISSSSSSSSSSSPFHNIVHSRIICVFLLVSLLLYPANASRSLPGTAGMEISNKYSKAAEYHQRKQCQISIPNASLGACDPSLVHVAMTLDSQYLRGSVAAVHSILKHTFCPQNVYFHFVASASSTPPDELSRMLKAIFPSLAFKVHFFAQERTRIKNLISSSIRQALDNPLNYARIYLAGIIEPCVERVIYLDSDTIVVDDIQKLWSINLSGSKVIGAPQYCDADFNKYFTDEFWFDPQLPNVFEGKKPCYFNTGVMVMELERWRRGDFTEKIEKWMEIQRERRIYELGSLPPFLLVFGGYVEPIDHRWNQHGLGGDNLENTCRSLHPGAVSLMHWSGKGKPWVRLDQGRPCPVDHLWAPYDLYRTNGNS